MGCSASKTTTVVPTGEGAKDLTNGDLSKTHDTNSSDTVSVLAPIEDDIAISSRTSKGLAFEVPFNEDDNMIKKHPPKRFQRLEDQQMSSLTHRLLDEKQAEAEQRRQQILSQRIQSAKSRQKLKRSFGTSGERNGLLIESMHYEPTTVEL